MGIKSIGQYNVGTGMNKRIIIVEDDAAISDILRIVLEKNGYSVEEFIHGQPLMEDNVEWPDLFLLDKQLADVDGLEICRHLKHKPETRQIPVVILSATPNLHTLVREAGADAFIEKPFTTKTLLHTIERLIYATADR